MNVYFLDKKFAGCVITIGDDAVRAAFERLDEGPTFRLSRAAQLVLPSNDSAKQLFADLGIAALGADADFCRNMVGWNYGKGTHRLTYRGGVFVFSQNNFEIGGTFRPPGAAIALDEQQARDIESYFEQNEGHFRLPLQKNQTIYARMASKNVACILPYVRPLGSEAVPKSATIDPDPAPDAPKLTFVGGLLTRLRSSRLVGWFSRADASGRNHGAPGAESSQRSGMADSVTGSPLDAVANRNSLMTQDGMPDKSDIHKTGSSAGRSFPGKGSGNER
jgi:hypothetical protein